MLTTSDMTDGELTRCYQIEDELVEARTMDQTTAKQYAAVCIERARVYAARLTTMMMPSYLSVWANEMAAATGKSSVKVHHNYLPWLEALMVVRYGEDASCWPAAVTEKDVERARRWKRGEQPSVVTI